MRQLALRAAVKRHWREKRQCLSPAFFFVLKKAVKSAGNAVIPTFPMHRSYGFQHLRHKRPRMLSPVKVGIHTRLSEKNRTQRLARRNTGVSDGGGITTLGLFHTFRKPCVAGPAGLRDLFRFCRNCGLYILRSGLSACMGQGWYHYPQCALRVVETLDGRLSKGLICRFLRSGDYLCFQR